MKKIQLSIILVISLLLISSNTNGQGKSKSKPAKNVKNETVTLFNGKNLENWVFYLKDQTIDPSTVFTVQNGVINIKGDPFGYMRTADSFSDYKLHVEWRWPAEPTNSGVFVHGQEPDAIWLKCIECQLMAGNAGDFVCMNGADMVEHTDKAKMVVKKMGESTEKQAGEWNTMEVTCKGNTIEVMINGVRQNKGTKVNVSKGSICLQSEGKDIQFKNVFLTRLK